MSSEGAGPSIGLGYLGDEMYGGTGQATSHEPDWHAYEHQPRCPWKATPSTDSASRLCSNTGVHLHYQAGFVDGFLPSAGAAVTR